MEEIVAKLKVDASNVSGALGSSGANNVVPVFVTNQNSAQAKSDRETQMKHGKQTAFAVTAGLAAWEGIKKGMDFLVKASPLLQGTLKVFGNSMKLLVKPVGDALAMVLRPFALAMLRWAVPFYQASMKGLQSTGGKVGGAIGVVGGAVGGAAAAGAIGGAIAGAKGVGALAGALGTAIAGPVGTAIGAAIGAVVGGLLGIFFGDKIEAWVSSAWDFLKSVEWKELFSNFISFWNEMPQMIVELLGAAFSKIFLEGIPYMVGVAFGAIETFFTVLLPAAWQSFVKFMKAIPGWIEDAWVATVEWFKDLPNKIREGWEIFANWVMDLPQKLFEAFWSAWTTLKEKITGAWEKIVDSAESAWSKMKSAFQAGREVTSVNDAIISPQGNVVTTNPRDYLIATTDPTSLVSGGNTTFAPQITVQATINNDMDVRVLAKKLAEYQKNELARRTNDFRI